MQTSAERKHEGNSSTAGAVAFDQGQSSAPATKVDRLRAMLASGEFHHATYRDLGTLWEGLRIYKRDKGPSGFRGYSMADLFFGKDDPELSAALAVVGPTGPSLGSYGNG